MSGPEDKRSYRISHLSQKLITFMILTLLQKKKMSLIVMNMNKVKVRKRRKKKKETVMKSPVKRVRLKKIKKRDRI
jgi:hypothetical protein